MKEQKTASGYIETVYGTSRFARTLAVNDAQSIVDLMQDFSDQQNAELRDQLKETENILDASTYNLKRVVKKCNTLTERMRELEAALAESEKVNFDLAAHQCDKWEPEENGHWSCRLQAQNSFFRNIISDLIIALEEYQEVWGYDESKLIDKAKEALKQEVNND